MPSAAPGQFLGRDHHGQVLGLAPGGEAAVGLGDREAEAAELAQARDDLLGDVGVRPVHVLGVGRTRSAAKRWNVAATMAYSSSRWRAPGVSARAASTAGSRWAVTKPAKGRYQSVGNGPVLLAAQDPARQVAQCQPGEGDGQRGLGVAVGCVVQRGRAVASALAAWATS